MSNIAQINNAKVSIVNFKSIPVVTTEMLADFYNTDVNNIKVNHSRNKSRFVEGKHYFKLEGIELKEFKNWVTQSNSVQISKNTRNLTLWTERGAARHAKMLDTDQAWDIFEQLEDCYFKRQEILAKTHKSERTALHEAHALLLTKTKHLSSSDAWKLIHQRFNVDHIEDIPYDAIPVAVEYVHHLIALYSNAGHKTHSLNAKALAQCMLWCRQWWKEYGDAIRTLNPDIAISVHDYFVDGAFLAWGFIDESEKLTLSNRLDSHQWNLSESERFKLV
jgi:hypothetical protein